MSQFDSFGKLFLVLGFAFLIIGAALLLSRHIPFLGKLPGDILIQKKAFAFYFPLATSILLSLIVTLILYLFSKR
ncbi:MAG TPA: DUF2905 domain-containing protein [bacterium]